ncbi:MFS transporter [Saccharomonospora sp. NB11]|jgi:MFS family permease|uniref:MFS transporter n=1 Tax=Saccharomonospora sp. NB11 TaxID=1642298 RepID=UPI0018D1DFD4|nr:MFS transporter [Saccharomonospora sp. NB11]
MLVLLSCLGQFLVVLDVSIVNVALPSIDAALRLDPVLTQWVVNAYALPFAGLLLVGGRLADLVGLRRVLRSGLALVAVASLLGGAATSAGVLLAARAGQGVGAAMVAPATLTLLTTTVPEGARRHRALAVWTAVGLAGGTLGNLAGGVLTEYLSWRWVLWVNVPFAVVAAVMAVRAPDRRGRRRPVDVPGALLAVLGLVALTLAVGDVGDTRPATWVVLVVAAGALGAFVAVERRWAAVPLLPPTLLRIPSVARGNVVMLLAGACLNPMWYFLTFAMQDVLGLGPSATGLGFLPHTMLTVVVGVWLTPRLLRVVAARTLVVSGALLAAVGFAWQSGLTAEAGYVAGVLGPAVFLALGSGLLNTPATILATSGIAEEDAGAASGLLNTTKQVGAALGLAALVAVTQFGDPLLAHGRAFAVMAVVSVATALAAMLLPAETSNTGQPRSGVASDRPG